MNFCVLAKISKRSVSFWYQSDGNPYSPLCIKESNEIPLYFYVKGNDFIFGNIARDLFNRHDPDAYGNYFEIIKDPGKHFSIYGNKKPVKQLFYYGVEQYLSHFINTILYKTDSIESYRQHFPLRFLFETDIDDNEKTLIESLFQEAGYFNLDRVHFHKILFSVLARKQVLLAGKAILLLKGIDDTLYLKLYKSIDVSATDSCKLQGQGADPRVKILADMIVDYIIQQNSYLSIDKNKEITFLLSYCVGLLENISPVIIGDAELSDGSVHWFTVKERVLNDRLQYNVNDGMVYSAMDDLIKTAGLKVEDVIILLGSEAISTSYFKNKLLQKYHHVKEVIAADRKDAMHAVFSEIARTGYRAKVKSPAAPPVFQKPPLPVAKLPPPLPPKKETAVPKPANIPKLPDVKPVDGTKVNPLKPPPLPPKK